MKNKGSETRKTSNEDNSFLFAKKESPRTESHIILELCEKRRRASDAFDRLKADHREYVAKFGRTWLMGG